MFCLVAMVSALTFACSDEGQSAPGSHRSAGDARADDARGDSGQSSARSSGTTGSASVDSGESSTETNSCGAADSASVDSGESSTETDTGATGSPTEESGVSSAPAGSTGTNGSASEDGGRSSPPSGSGDPGSRDASVSASVDSGEGPPPAASSGASTGNDGGLGNEAPATCSVSSRMGLPGLPIYPFRVGSYNPVAAHLDNDDQVDLALSGYGSRVGVLSGRGNGHFTTPWHFPQTVQSQSWGAVAASDLDSDGHTDLVLLGESGVTAFLNDGTGWFEAVSGFAAWPGWGGLALADLNSDGHVDIVAATELGASIHVALNRGDGTFGGPVVFGAGLGYSLAPAISAVDMTGDEVIDLVVASRDGAEVAVFAGNNDGSFEAGVPYLTGISPSTTPGRTAFVTEDFDADGAVDLAITTVNTAQVYVLSNDGSGALVASASHAVSPGPHGLLAEDLDGKNGVDLVVASAQSGHVNVLLNRGDGDFARGAAYIAGPLPGGVTAADFNRDGAPDLVVANQELADFTQTTGVTVLFNRGDGTFAQEPTYAAGTAPYALSSGDLDADGKLDLVVANRDSNDVSVLLNQGEVFGGAVAYAMGTRPSAVVTADCNADGTLDVVTANAGSDNISVRLNDGHGLLGSVASYAVGAEPSAIVAGDFNDDGVMDLAVTTLQDARLAVLINRGDGSFDTRVEYATGLEPIALAAADFTGDGSLDLAVANFGSMSVSVFRNLGDGNLELTEIKDLGPEPGLGPNPTAIIPWDLLGDGKIDLITANAYAGTLSVLFNQGGWFSGPGPVQNYTEEGVNSLAVGDLDGDGKRELVMASSAGVVFALRTNGNGFLESSVVDYYKSGSNSRAVTLGDWNGDGRLDIAVVNPDPHDNVVRILVNACVPPPVRPSPAVGLKLDITRSATCPIGDPAPDQIGEPPPDEQRTLGEPKGTPLSDGGDRWARVACAVARGAGFRVRANIETYSVSLELDAPTLDAEGRGTFSIEFFSTEVGGWLRSSTCTIEPIASGAGSGIEPGAVWARFSCVGMLEDYQVVHPPMTCDVSGEILLQNCDPGS
jgi:FG-GAP-like repeat